MFQQIAVIGAVMYESGGRQAQARFTAVSHRKIVAVIAFLRKAQEANETIGAKSFKMSWAF